MTLSICLPCKRAN